MNRVTCLGTHECGRISNATVELLVALDVGPRVVRYAFLGEENIFAEVPEMSMHTALGEWKPWGGHRLWAAPEALPRTYTIDNQPVECDVISERSVRLRQPAGDLTSYMEKELTVSLDAAGTGVTIHHKLLNRGREKNTVAPWALTIMNGGGLAIVPQEPYRPHEDELLPARPLVLWHFTKLGDPRFYLGDNYICLRCDAGEPSPQKFGVTNKQGWSAYLRHRTLFVKNFACDSTATYPDYGSNNEIYTAGSFIELESLGPLHHLEPGESAEHIERWNLFRTGALTEITDAAIEKLISPVLQQIKAE